MTDQPQPAQAGTAGVSVVAAGTAAHPDRPLTAAERRHLGLTDPPEQGTDQQEGQ